jgi:hypothetical protein
MTQVVLAAHGSFNEIEHVLCRVDYGLARCVHAGAGIICHHFSSPAPNMRPSFLSATPLI